MYQSHFGLRQRPFRSTPDAGAYYPATVHETALQQLRQAIADDEPVALLVARREPAKRSLLPSCSTALASRRRGCS